MSGTNQSKITVTLRNPLDYNDTLDYTIRVYDNPLAKDWVTALKELLQDKNQIEKNFCFIGFPNSQRNLDYLCGELNHAVETINHFNYKGIWQAHGLKSYIIEDWYHPNTVRFPDSYAILVRTDSDIRDEGHPDQQIGLSPKQQTLNRLHNYFEQLQGTVWDLSPYYKLADYETKYAIRQLNILCHEIEGLTLSQRKQRVMPEWVRPSQITTFLHAKRHDLKDEHRELFVANGYDRRFGHVYMHWTQIGKTLFEVWRDEGAPKLNVGQDPTDISVGSGATCEAITALKHFSGEFDVEWGKDVVLDDSCWWHVREQGEFKEWLTSNGLDPTNKELSLGYLPIGEVELLSSFGTTDIFKIWQMLSNHLDIVSIEVDGIKNTFNYCWTDSDYKQRQIDMMRPGYDHSSRG